MLRTRNAGGTFLFSLFLGLLATTAQADILLTDFQGGTGFAPWNVDSNVLGVVVDDTEPDFPGDKVGIINDSDGGFQTVLQMDGQPLLFDLHNLDTFSWEVDSADYSGDFLNNFLVFQSNDPIGFAVLGGSNVFMNKTTDDQFYSHNYGAGDGRTILDTIDADHDGVLDTGFDFFNIFVIQQVADNTTSSVRYDDFRITAIPEPASISLVVLSSILMGAMRRFGQSA